MIQDRKGVIKMQTKIGKFTFAVPDGHPEAGTKIEKAFEYLQVDGDVEVDGIMAEKHWSLVNLVNDQLKTNARSNAYQTALLPYLPSKVSAGDIKERMIRDFIRLGSTEEVARKSVEAVLAASVE